MKKSGSVKAGQGFAVAPSPFNEVKLDLGIILSVGVLLLLVQGRIMDSLFGQFLVLGGYALLGMGWMLIRTRRILSRLSSEQQRHEP